MGIAFVITLHDERLNALREAAPRIAAEMMAEGSELTLDIARRTAWVRTGFLRDSGFEIHTENRFLVVFAAFYAWFNEVGTKYWAGHPFAAISVESIDWDELVHSVIVGLGF